MDGELKQIIEKSLKEVFSSLKIKTGKANGDGVANSGIVFGDIKSGIDEKAFYDTMNSAVARISERIAQSGEKVTEDVVKKLCEVVHDKMCCAVAKLSDGQAAGEREIKNAFQANFALLQKNMGAFTDGLFADLKSQQKQLGNIEDAIQSLADLYNTQAKKLFDRIDRLAIDVGRVHDDVKRIFEQLSILQNGMSRLQINDSNTDVSYTKALGDIFQRIEILSAEIDDIPRDGSDVKEQIDECKNSIAKLFEQEKQIFCSLIEIKASNESLEEMNNINSAKLDLALELMQLIMARESRSVQEVKDDSETVDRITNTLEPIATNEETVNSVLKLQIKIYCDYLRSQFNDILLGEKLYFIGAKEYRNKFISTCQIHGIIVDEKYVLGAEKEIVGVLHPTPLMFKNMANIELDTIRDELLSIAINPEWTATVNSYIESLSGQFNDILLGSANGFYSPNAYKERLFCSIDGYGMPYDADYFEATEQLLLSKLRGDSYRIPIDRKPFANRKVDMLEDALIGRYCLSAA